MATSAKQYIVVYRSGARSNAAKVLTRRGGVSFANEFNAGEGEMDLRDVGEDPVVFDQLDMAAVTLDEEAAAGVQATRSASILLIEEVREYTVQPVTGSFGAEEELDPSLLDVDGLPPGAPASSPGMFPPGLGPTVAVPGGGGGISAMPGISSVPAVPGDLPAYLQGYIHGVSGLAGNLLGTLPAGFSGGQGMALPVVATPTGVAAVQGMATTPGFPLPTTLADASVASESFTWGLEAIRASLSRLTGAGVKVAILDTGFDFGHKDFPESRFGGRNFFVTSSAQDIHGHGTHCTGTACGPRSATGGYGVAPEATIYVGKVMDDRGKGDTRTIAAGINWALQNGCRVCSISIGAKQPPSQVVEIAAQRAIQQNMAVIAAAGNDSRRPTIRRPVSDPANCASVMAVASVRQQGSGFALSSFSNGAVPSKGWSIDIAAPGERVFSSYPRAKNEYVESSGTSMATPHVAGVAALIAQSRPDWQGWGIMNALLQLAAPLPIPVGQAGRGLVQAPLNARWN